MLFPHGPRVPGAVSEPHPARPGTRSAPQWAAAQQTGGPMMTSGGQDRHQLHSNQKDQGIGTLSPQGCPPTHSWEGRELRAFQISPPDKCMFISAGTPVYPTPPVTLGPGHGRGGGGGGLSMANSPELLSRTLGTCHTTGAAHPHKLGRPCSKMPWRSSWFDVSHLPKRPLLQQP